MTEKKETTENVQEKATEATVSQKEFDKVKAENAELRKKNVALHNENQRLKDSVAPQKPKGDFVFEEKKGYTFKERK